MVEASGGAFDRVYGASVDLSRNFTFAVVALLA